VNLPKGNSSENPALPVQAGLGWREIMALADLNSGRELMMQFEPLGSDCEFGVIQRRSGFGSPGLFKRNGMPLTTLISALEARFEGLGDPENLEIEFESGEFTVHDLRFGWRYKHWLTEEEISIEKLHKSESQRLRLLSKKFVEDLTNSEKIFVFKRSQLIRHQFMPSIENIILPLHQAMRAYGPASLLWVFLSNDKYQAGTIEVLRPGLMLGFLENFFDAKANPDQIEQVIEGWTSLCMKATRIREEYIGMA
jgi:hypothetical protein